MKLSSQVGVEDSQFLITGFMGKSCQRHSRPCFYAHVIRARSICQRAFAFRNKPQLDYHEQVRPSIPAPLKKTCYAEFQSWACTSAHVNLSASSAKVWCKPISMACKIRICVVTEIHLDDHPIDGACVASW